MTDQLDIFRPPPPWMPANFSEIALTEMEQKIMRTLKVHQGKRRAITVADIADACAPDGMTDAERRNFGRTVRDTLKHLTETHAIGIATHASGVFLLETADELDEYVLNLKKRALSTLRRMAILKKTKMAELCGQIAIEIENG